MHLLKPGGPNNLSSQITVTINHKADVMGKAMAAHDELPALSIIAVEPSMPTTHRDNYSIDVNVACNGKQLYGYLWLWQTITSSDTVDQQLNLTVLVSFSFCKSLFSACR